MWKIEKIVSKGDYDYAIVRDHPNRTKNDYVLHHRVVVENHLGRLLESSEVVHHIDGNKKNNLLSNLEVMSVSEHARHHGQEISRKYVDLKCPECGKEFIREKNQTHLQKGTSYTACSRSCSGKFSSKVRLKRLSTAEVEAAISGNIVREYDK